MLFGGFCSLLNGFYSCDNVGTNCLFCFHGGGAGVGPRLAPAVLHNGVRRVLGSSLLPNHVVDEANEYGVSVCENHNEGQGKVNAFACTN